MKINYHNRKFRVLTNSRNGEASADTVFRYYQDGTMVWGDYAGGEVVRGALIAKMDDKGRLSMTYQHINREGEVRTGCCHSTPELLPDGRLRMHEKWQWTFGDEK